MCTSREKIAGKVLHYYIDQSLYTGAKIVHFTNARPSFGQNGPCQVHAVYTMHTYRAIYRYNVVCDVKHTSAIQMLHVCYVQFSGKIGDWGP